MKIEDIEIGKSYKVEDIADPIRATVIHIDDTSFEGVTEANSVWWVDVADVEEEV